MLSKDRIFFFIKEKGDRKVFGNGRNNDHFNEYVWVDML